MITELFSTNLLIALEPECASLYCRTLPFDKFIGLGHDNAPRLKKGTVYMTVDLGGRCDSTLCQVFIHSLKDEITIPGLNLKIAFYCRWYVLMF